MKTNSERVLCIKHEHHAKYFILKVENEMEDGVEFRRTFRVGAKIFSRTAAIVSKHVHLTTLGTLSYHVLPITP